TGVVFQQRVIHDEDIPKLCERTASLQSEIKWSYNLLVTRQKDSDGQIRPIPYSLGAIEAIHSYWNVPYNHIPSFKSIESCNITFSPIIGNESWKGLVIEMSTATSLVTYDSANHRTFGLCLLRFEEDGERLVRRIERLPNFAANPLFAPFLIAEIAVHGTEYQIDKDYGASLRMEEALGYWSQDSDERVEKDLNFANMIQSLNTLSIAVANTEYIQTRMISAIELLNDQVPVWPKEPGALVGIELQEQARLLQQFTLNWRAVSRRTKDSVQSMTQTIYATLQQRDNQLNHRYGADMRLITAITLIFLPGTFIATFFSTTFWDFSPGNRGAKVTYWVYLYFAVTIGLTLLVLVVWRSFSVFKRLTTSMVQVMHRIPLLGRLIKKKRVDDEELGKKGD
ncbi:hypothetical protein GT037_006513, partial [Alternaria burnsii]